jgi:hypothetical protein
METIYVYKNDISVRADYNFCGTSKYLNADGNEVEPSF